MHVYLLSLLFILNTSLDRTPNFYPNYIAAREASKNYNKDLLIFISKKSCADCDAAWTNFEKDPVASKLYISTSVNIQDFDGAVFLDKYGLKNAPAWVVLDPQGDVKDKWEGEWKKTPTRPATPEPEKGTNPIVEKVSTPGTESKEAPVTKVAKTEPAPAQPKTEVDIPTKEVVDLTPVVEEKTTAETAVESVKETAQAILTAPVESQPEISGYVIQAGFFSSQLNAKGLITALDMKGFSNFSIKPSMREGSTFYRVISNTYPTEAEAQARIDAMQEADIKASIKNQKDIID